MDKNEGFVTDIKDKDELKEIDKIGNMLNPNEKVLLVARQSRFLSGGSFSLSTSISSDISCAVATLL